MRALLVSLGLASAALVAGCLNQIIPTHDATTTQGSGGGTPIYDMGHQWAADPVGDGGTPIEFKDIQVQMDKLGCTTTMCHGGTTPPVIVASPTDNAVMLNNYYDLLSGCGTGAPDPSDCVDPIGVDDSVFLTKTCQASGVAHMGGYVFQDSTDPMYQLWRGWIAAGAPYQAPSP